MMPPSPASAEPARAEPAPATPKASPAAIATLLARGDALLALGDVATARLVYQRAASLDSAQGALATGKTFDPRFLRKMGAVGVVSDPEAARSWYRKAAALGDAEAPRLLASLDAGTPR